jgi:hypothetical protein
VKFLSPVQVQDSNGELRKVARVENTDGDPGDTIFIGEGTPSPTIQDGDAWLGPAGVSTRDGGVWEEATGSASDLSFVTTKGNGSSVTFDVTHNLGTRSVVVAAWEVSTGQQLTLAPLILNDNTVRVTFVTPPANNDARIVVLSSGGEQAENVVLDPSRSWIGWGL